MDKRTLYMIGKEMYDFDMSEEIEIYFYVCCQKNMNKKEKIKEEYKFNSYLSWRNYIIQKYKDWDIDRLINFSRFLNQLKRNKKAHLSICNMMLPVLFTIFLSSCFSFILNLDFKDVIVRNYIEFIILGIIIFVLIIFALFILAYMVKEIIEPVYSFDMEGNFYADYKEIVDDIIKEM